MLSKRELAEKRKIFSESDKTITAAFKVLSDLNRYRIFRILAEQPKYSVSNIAHILNISLPLTSQHIKVLVLAGLIQKERRGKKVFPKIEYSNPFVQAVVKTIELARSSSQK